MGRIASIDYGMKRIGLAISDENKIIARAIGTILTERKFSKTVEKLLETLKEFKIEKIVVGLPLRMNGKHGIITDEVLLFIEELKKKASCEIVTWDERLTSRQADNLLREAKLTRKKRKKSVDTVSATIILQSYLDSLENTLLPEDYLC